MRQPGRYVVHAGVLAVHRAERVVHVGVAERGELVGERAPLRVVLAGLALVEPQVLQQRDLPVGQVGHACPRRVADGVLGEVHRGAEQLTEPPGDRAEAELRVRRALRAAQVRADDHLRAGPHQRAQRRQDGPDPAVVADLPGLLVERDVQVGAHQHAPTRHPLGEQVVEVTDRHSD